MEKKKVIQKKEKMDIGDFIYIAFVVVSIILGILGNKKKKQAAASGNTDYNASDEVRKQFEALFGIEEQVAFMQQQSRAERLIVKETPPPVQLKTFKPKSIPPKTQTKTTRRAMQRKIDEAEAVVVLSGYDFNLRQAIINDAILNPPYKD